MTVHVWVPEYTSAVGGIQTFSRFIVRALRDIFPNATLAVISKNDTSLPDPSDDPTDRFTPLGWWPLRLRTGAFTAELISQAWHDRPSLIVTTHVNFAPVAFYINRVLRTPYLAIGHGIEVWNLRPGAVARALRRAAAVAAVSHYTRERLAARLRLQAERITVLPNTFDADHFFPDTRKPRFLLKRYGLRPEQPVILTIARLASAERYKGYDEVLQALPKVRQSFPEVRYIIGGRGPDRLRVEGLIRELGLTENVILAGYVPDHELRAYYNLCDVFAMPSKGEGFGIVFLEALGCGKPVIAGNMDGSVDAVLQGETGKLVDPDNVAEIAKALIQTLSSKDDGEAENRRRRTIEQFGYDRFVVRLDGIVSKLVSAQRGKS